MLYVKCSGVHRAKREPAGCWYDLEEYHWAQGKMRQKQIINRREHNRPRTRTYVRTGCVLLDAGSPEISGCWGLGEWRSEGSSLCGAALLKSVSSVGRSGIFLTLWRQCVLCCLVTMFKGSGVFNFTWTCVKYDTNFLRNWWFLYLKRPEPSAFKQYLSNGWTSTTVPVVMPPWFYMKHLSPSARGVGDKRAYLAGLHKSCSNWLLFSSLSSLPSDVSPYIGDEQ